RHARLYDEFEATGGRPTDRPQHGLRSRAQRRRPEDGAQRHPSFATWDFVMNRLLLALAAAVLLALWGADVVSAQAPPAGQETAPAVESHDANWPTYPLNGHEPSRGPGFYLALWKIFLIFFIVWLWVRTTDWVS